MGKGGWRGRAWRPRSSFTPAATHGFDDTSAKRQHVTANAAATEDAVEQAVRFFLERLGGRE
jgi:dienelactone hydrolase